MDRKLLIAEPIAEELNKFDSYYKEAISCDNPRIQNIIDYIMKSDGKKIRPVLLLLAAKACGEINNITYYSAITVELLHTASLIHDDVVDESKIRRGKASVNATFDNKMAVLAGDYFLSTALIKSVLTSNIDIITSISNLGRNLAEGELNQLSLVKEIIIEEKEYFEVIKKKTASLISVCMRIGALSVGATEKDVNMFAQLGEYLGICFQMKDDIFDYFSDDVGKPTGNDIKEGKITLPLLYALKNSDTIESEKLLSIINEHNFTEENIEKLIQFAKKNGGIEYTYQKIEEYKNKALDIINSLSEDKIKKALINTVEYIIERNY
ncbi:polyprenyl synthetase family protein [Dysgonomonas sp. 216]|uniref:polyprenyl synthetase family protein n=1 Tax=Dysgonomonas sp. 216 TaxID=2302934 RepID=UPI0013CFB036|nr:polyprenyl synthetase family protein [Dysgonomonas sp. 216]NDW17656.1 polyprenyl synthetase family protein [Dysgonomonas sp. 216]